MGLNLRSCQRKIGVTDSKLMRRRTRATAENRLLGKENRMSLEQWTASLAACFLHLSATAQVSRDWAACPTPLEFRCRADPTCSRVGCSARAANRPLQPSLKTELARRELSGSPACKPGALGKGGAYNPATQTCSFGSISPKVKGDASSKLEPLPNHRPFARADCAAGPLGKGGAYSLLTQACDQGRIVETTPDAK